MEEPSDKVKEVSEFEDDYGVRMSPCESCHAGCCRAFAVPVTGADILRIERQLQLGFGDFVCRWADPDGNIARNYAPQFHFADEPETPFVICLRHTASEFFPRTTKCRFLLEGEPDAENPLGQARCGIHAARPGACRVFPTKLNETGELAVIYDVPENGRPAEPAATYSLCPRPWEPTDIDTLTGIQDLVVARYEMGFFKQLANLWNRKPREWSLFPEFLRLVYESRVLKNMETDDEPPQTIPFPTPSHSSEQRVA